MDRDTNNRGSPRSNDDGARSNQPRPKRYCDGLSWFDRYCGAQILHTFERQKSALSRFRCRKVSPLFCTPLYSLISVVQPYRNRASPHRGDNQGELVVRGTQEQNAIKDLDEDLSRRLRAAQGGDATAQFYIGRKYEIGRGLPKDPALATQWYIHAANQGNARAQECLAIMYAEGRCVPPDNPRAAYWHRRLSRQSPTQH
jgi:hypothetical protein